MKKDKLAIISSFDDFCGNASYTKSLYEGLTKYYEVTIISLNVGLIREGSTKRVYKYIQQLKNQLISYDCVNIQFEEGLFGSNMSSIKKNFFALAKASKKLVLTMHRIHGDVQYPSFIFLGKTIFRKGPKPFINAWLKAYAVNRHVRLYKKIIKFCKKNQIPLLVHTPKCKNCIKEKFRYNLVFDHPLSFYDQDYILELASGYSRDDFCNDLALDKKEIHIGLFGFISCYKGHETAIKSLSILPKNYKLLIFGAQHPHTIKIGETINEYIESLITLITTLQLHNRVQFHRIGNDEDFLKTLLRCDFNILPYLEVNQAGSGIAALSLETNSNAIFSQTNAFFELEKYAPDAFKLFTIGNYHELANAIMSYRKEKYLPNLDKYHKKYNLSTNASLYHKLLSRDFSSISQDQA